MWVLGIWVRGYLLRFSGDFVGAVLCASPAVLGGYLSGSLRRSNKRRECCLGSLRVPFPEIGKFS